MPTDAIPESGVVPILNSPVTVMNMPVATGSFSIGTRSTKTVPITAMYPAVK